MKGLTLFSILISLLLAMSTAANAQSCTTATCTAATANEADVLAALPSSGNTNATVVVNIPAGSASWTTGFSYSIPSAVTNLTVQGATTIVWSGTPGTSTWAYSITDNTTITDADTTTTPLMTFTTGAASTYFRITGLTLNSGTLSGNTKYGAIVVQGSSHNFRLDHNHYTVPKTGGAFIRVGGNVLGVADHNELDLGTNTSTSNGLQAFDPYSDKIGNGDGAFTNPTPWGSANAFYMEDNYFNGGAPDDCAEAGFFVMRYNTLNDAYVAIQTHGTKSPAGPGRGCRGYEAYHNYITGPSGSPASGATGAKGTTAMVWGNTMPQGYYRFFEASGDRNSGDEIETNTPNGWGYCGTAVNSNGVGSMWDGNAPSGTSPTAEGYPCLDGLGRGQTQQALNGQNFPNRLNSATGTIAWPKQYLEPIYLWNNSIGSATYVLIQDAVTTNNRDYYYDCGSQNSSCSSGFTGAAGTGYGLLANRPASCTAGAGGTYLTSPTGSYGVAYFATDANSGNGELYVCTSTNTWTAVYQPYTYPHPLESGTLQATAPQPPTALTASAN